MSSDRILLLALALVGVDLATRAVDRWPAALAAEPAAADRLCRMFNHPLVGDYVLDTSDATSEAGRWVAERRAAGWQVADVDFEVGQKQSGYPAGYVHVCLQR